LSLEVSCCSFSSILIIDPDVCTKFLAGRKNILNQRLQAMQVQYQGVAADPGELLLGDF